MSKTHVIYHKSDFDGIFCREIARKFLPEAELIGWEYGEPTPCVPLDCTLYILDLSVEGLMDHSGLIWIDHHKTAIDKYPATITGYRIDGVAACRLAWQWFTAFPGFVALPGKRDFIDWSVEEPTSVTLAGEYDVWDKRNPDAELFQHGLRSEEIQWERLWAKNAAGYVQHLMYQGKAIQYAKAQENEIIIRNNGFTVQWEGLTFLCCNAGSYNSLLFAAGIKPEHDALLGFCLRKDGRWTISLYGVPGKPDVDLSVIAKKYGGGGHKQACGFRSEMLPFR